MKFLSKTLLSGFVLFAASPVFANVDDATLFKRYEQAKLKLAYEGEVGDLLQLVANRLNVGYLSYKTDPTQTIQISSNEPITIKELLKKVETQVPDLTLHFEKIGANVFIAATHSKTPLKLKHDTFISEAIFDEEAKTQDSSTPNNQIELVVEPESPTHSSAQEVSETKKP